MTTATHDPRLPIYPSYADDPVQLSPEVARYLHSGVVPRLALATGDHVFLVTTYEQCRAVLADTRFSRNVGRPDAAQLLEGVRMPSQPLADPPVHTTWRRQLVQCFNARRIEGLRPQVVGIVDNRLDALESSDFPDLVEHVAYPVPINVVCALLGLQPEEHEPFRDLASVALATDDTTPADKANAFAGLAELSRQVVTSRMASPRSDLLSELIANGGGTLTEAELVATVMTLLIGGYENPAHQIAKMFYSLFRHPRQLAQISADPSLVEAAVEECLRWVGALDSGFGSPRYATEDVMVGDTLIPQGSTIIVNRQAANRDHRRFDNPEEFNINRPPAPHISFGHGAHHCIGAALARIELTVVLGRTLERFPRIAPTQPVSNTLWGYRVTASGPTRLTVHLDGVPSRG